MRSRPTRLDDELAPLWLERGAVVIPLVRCPDCERPLETLAVQPSTGPRGEVTYTLRLLMWCQVDEQHFELQVLP